MVSTYDISVTQGVPLYLSLNLKDDSGNYINLSGYTSTGVVRANYSNSIPLFTFIPTIDPSYTSGLITINIPASGTSNIPVLQGVYDIYVFGATIFPVLLGNFLVNPSATTEGSNQTVPFSSIYPSGVFSSGVVDIANEIYQELGSPADISIPVISYWLRNNIGQLNSAINTAFYVDGTTYNIYQIDERDPSNPITLSLMNEEKSVYKKIYSIYYYDIQIRKNMLSYVIQPAVEITSDGHTVRLTSPTEIGKNLHMWRQALISELKGMITDYKLNKNVPRQIVGDDTEIPAFGQQSILYRRTYPIYGVEE